MWPIAAAETPKIKYARMFAYSSTHRIGQHVLGTDARPMMALASAATRTWRLYVIGAARCAVARRKKC